MTTAEPNPYAAPQSIEARLEPADEVADALVVQERSLRFAGLLLVVGAGLNIVSTAAFDSTAIRTTYSGGVIAIGFDVWIGFSLIRRRFGVRSWALIRSSVGAVLLGGVPLLGGRWVEGILALASCASIILLVAPGPTRLRMGIAGGMYGLVTMLAIIGLALMGARR